MEQTIDEIASSARELPEIDFPEDIPPAPVPGKPEKLARFSRTTVEGNKYFTDKQVLGHLVREGKASQHRVDDWKKFIEEQGITI
jgi:hypothetical protein